MGLAFDPLDEAETVANILDAVRARRGGWICPTNLDVLRQRTASLQIRELVDSADLVVADGMPLVWASRVAGTPLPERVAGSALIWSLSAAAAPAGASVFLLGGNLGAAEDAARILGECTPGLRVAGTLHPPFGFDRDPDALAAIEDALRAAQPDLVFVGLGFPKQERLIQGLRSVLPASYFVSCGIAFSYVSGDVARAPGWARRLGLEWVHRLAQEPRRLARRYLLDGLPFATRLMAEAVRTRLAAPRT